MDDDHLGGIRVAVLSITDVFQVPLEARGVDLTLILDEGKT